MQELIRVMCPSTENTSGWKDFCQGGIWHYGGTEISAALEEGQI